jgi:hypothetical protein
VLQDIDRLAEFLAADFRELRDAVGVVGKRPEAEIDSHEAEPLATTTAERGAEAEEVLAGRRSAP